MVVLRAIGGFFARIGRWIKETAWIQPLLIVGAIFAVIFAIPHIIDGVKGWFNSSDDANKYFAKTQLSLKNANKFDSNNAGSEVDKFFTYIENGDVEKLKADKRGERFFVAFVKDDSSCNDLYGGLKTFQEKWKNNDKEFVGDKKDALAGDFKLWTIYTDTKETIDNEEVNLFDKVWLNHYSLFENLVDGTYLPKTYYAMNKNYSVSNYESNFTSDSLDTCPINTPLLMYFDFTADCEKNGIALANQKVKGLSDVIFTVDGSSDLERARTLKKCWSHTDLFGKVLKN